MIRQVLRFSLAAINAVLKRLGFQFIRTNGRPSSSSNFVAAETIIRNAREKGVSVSDLVALNLYTKSHGQRDFVISEMTSCGSLNSPQNICEIGPGTGTYLDPIRRKFSSSHYEIYETAADWRDWLVETFGVIAQPTDGFTLALTPHKSQDLVHAHGVFVYLPHVHLLSYFSEMARVCNNGGYVVFDYFTLDDFGLDALARWRATEHRFPVVYPRQWVKDFFIERGFKLVHEFEKPYYASNSHYVVFRRGSGEQ
jgi:SAM-dependent methyltransferase